MVIDTSALLAILLAESDAEIFAEAIARETQCFISAASILETHIVILNRYGEGGVSDLDFFVKRAGASIEPVTNDQLVFARRAYDLYGKGRHPACLNFGDCFPYALSKLTGNTLLFKGQDFSKTDIESALS